MRARIAPRRRPVLRAADSTGSLTAISASVRDALGVSGSEADSLTKASAPLLALTDALRRSGDDFVTGVRAA